MKPINIHGASYYTVKTKLAYFREKFPYYSLESVLVAETDSSITFRAWIKDQFGVITASGTAREAISSKADAKWALENCETSAWGRALSNLLGLNDGEIASLEDIERPEPISEEQKTEINRLLWNVDAEGYRRQFKVSDFSEARVRQVLDSITAEQAQDLIWKLEATQMMGNIKAGNGGAKQKEIQKAVKEITK